MSENRWTENDFVQLARPKMMAAADPRALPHLLYEFFTEALPHYDNATVDGKAYIEKAISNLTSLFEAERRDPDTLDPRNMKDAIEPLNTLLDAWRNNHPSGDPSE
jgi:hypothetical protein